MLIAQYRVLVRLGICFAVIGQFLTAQPASKHIASDPYHRQDDKSGTEVLGNYTNAVSRTLPHSSESNTPPVNNYIDKFVFKELAECRIPRAGLTSDVEFLRRVSLDLTGRLPEPDKIRQFAKDSDPKKREKLIDAMLATPTKGLTEKLKSPFLERWTYFFGDLFRIGNYNGQGRTLFRNYIYNALLVNEPYDEFVRSLLTSTTRSTHYSAEGNFLARYYVDEPDQSHVNHEDYYDELAIHTGRLFLGVNLECVSCHDGKGHLDKINLWLSGVKRADLWRQAAFFSNVKLTRPYADLLDEFALTNEGKGYYDTSNHSVLRLPRYHADVTPVFLLTGERPKSGEDPRQAFARMLTTNIQFARATVNLFWAEIFGAGIVDPPTAFDFVRYGGEPQKLPPGWTLQTPYADLLDAMARDFQDHQYDLRYLLRLITTSSTYQLSHRITGPWKPEYAQYFGRHLVHRMTAEEIYDAIQQATGVFDEFSSGDFGPKVKYVMQTISPDDLNGRVGALLSAFGMTDRNVKARSNAPSTVQASFLMNSDVIREKLKADAKDSRLSKLFSADPPKSNSEIVEELFLATLARFPSPQESELSTKLLQDSHIQGAEDLMWALINKPEFQLNY